MKYKNEKLNIEIENSEPFEIKELENYIELYSDNVLKFKIFKNSTVIACENSTVFAYWKSKVYAYENTAVFAYEKSKVYAFENSKVRAYEKSKVLAFDNSEVSDYEKSKVIRKGERK